MRSILTFIRHPLTAFALFISSTWCWHVPALFDLVFEYPFLHFVEHASFLGTSIIFWRPIFDTLSFATQPSSWWLIPYLLFADIQNTILSAVLTFSSRPLYAHYVDMPRIINVTPLDDQMLAGVLMWVPGSIAFFAPLTWITLRLLLAPGCSSGRKIPFIRATSSIRTTSLPLLLILNQTGATAPNKGKALIFLVFLFWEQCYVGELLDL